MRISDWSSDVCSSDLRLSRTRGLLRGRRDRNWQRGAGRGPDGGAERARRRRCRREPALYGDGAGWRADRGALPAVELRFLEQGTARTGAGGLEGRRSEEHTSELQSLMRISYAVFCLKNKKYERNCINQYRFNT